MQINGIQILFQIVNFGVVAGLLTYLLYDPIQNILGERRDRIEAAQRAAEESMAARKQAEAKKAELLEEAKEQAKQITAEAKKQAQATESEILSQAQNKARQTVEQAKESWEQEKAQLVTEMREEFATAVTATAAAVLGESIDKKQHKALIEKHLDTVVEKI